MPAASSRGRARRTKNEINMVPFIDVMLVLLIIFMVTAPLITPSQIEVPSAGESASRPPAKYVSVIIEKNETIEVREGPSGKDGNTVKLSQLAREVQQWRARIDTAPDAKVAVMISADKGVQYEAVVNAMSTLREAGIGPIGLAVKTSR
ncbi:ExbD/TolR family protein [Hydrogenophaga sp. NFH-34]|uniref:ExbD/TolR family protein n=1 Tax=Hydrogenophaga sp. NFH-34 TaxID=2744446 RepID=UPI001F47898D|nr:biopolymer transporter ExbD [Hydrogenophaga sp. NFH-34]